MFVFFALLASNFLYQALLADPNYIVALERTYFQGSAILLYWWYNTKANSN